MELKSIYFCRTVMNTHTPQPICLLGFTFFLLYHMTPEVIVRLPGDGCYGRVTMTTWQLCGDGFYQILPVQQADSSQACSASGLPEGDI